MIAAMFGLDGWKIALIVWAGLELLFGLGAAAVETAKAYRDAEREKACPMDYYRSSKTGDCEPVVPAPEPTTAEASTELMPPAEVARQWPANKADCVKITESLADLRACMGATP